MMPEGVFVDTGFFLALVNRRDEYHSRAAEYSRRDFPILLTTEAVLTEVANSLSRVQWRPLAANLVEEVRRDPRFTVVSVSTTLFGEALHLYSSRNDKEWSLTDCISFVVMNQQRLTEAPDVVITVRIGNGGAAIAPAPAPTSPCRRSVRVRIFEEDDVERTGNDLLALIANGGGEGAGNVESRSINNECRCIDSGDGEIRKPGT